MNFDIKEMIGKIALPEAEGGKGFTDIVTQRDGVNWVHAGIAFFGGGKNYGVFENNITDSTIGTVSNYSISFADVGREYMTAAAGTEPFYFCLYNQKYGISVDKQQSDLTSPNGDAYAPIKIK